MFRSYLYDQLRSKTREGKERNALFTSERKGRPKEKRRGRQTDTERDRDRETERERDRERDRDRETETERETDRERATETGRDRDRKKESVRNALTVNRVEALFKVWRGMGGERGTEIAGGLYRFISSRLE